MKILFVNTYYKDKVVLPEKLIKKLPKKIALFTTIQYYNSLEEIKKQLQQAEIEVELIESRHALLPGQILGCSIEKFNRDVEAFLYIGDGRFHPLALTYNNDKKIFTYNPMTKDFSELSEKDIERFKKRRNAAISSFLASKIIGVLITTKYGQNRIELALQLEKKYPEKEFFYLIADDIVPENLENFPFIECFVNTACPRIIDDYERFHKPVINIADLGFSW